MDDKIKMTISSVSKVVNISAAKKVAFPIAVLLVVVQGLRYIDSGNACRRLLDGGTLMDGDVWQPNGCMLHNYKQSDSKHCMENRRIAFIGDSRLRDMFYEFVNMIAPSSFENHEKMHSNISFQEGNIDIEFMWYPEVNSSVTDLYQAWLEDSSSQPHIIIQSAATHTIKRTGGSDIGLMNFKYNLTKTAPLMQEALSKENTKLFWLLQEPVVEGLLHESRKAITNSQISDYNEAALSILEDKNGLNVFPNIYAIKSTMQVALENMKSSVDGLHVGEGIKLIDLQILLNLFCNDVIKPVDGSCCQQPPSTSAVQLIAFATGCLCVVASIGANLFLGKKSSICNGNPEVGGEASQDNEANMSSAFKEIMSASARMALILLYFYICDRTDIFMKSNKHYTHIRFFIPLLYVVFLGIFGMDQTKSTSLLNRDQTDEWKGWMQLIILIYHITGASVNVPIYMHIRLLVSMYLFMTGYGHFSYFWNKGDFSFYRVFSVMFRLNFLTVMLCIVMDRPYQFYYFVPLCSFWFLVLYVSMALWPRAYSIPSKPTTKPDGVVELKEMFENGPSRRSPTVIMCFKLMLLTVVIMLLFMSQDIFETLYSWWPAVRLFELPPGSVREWWFRCQLDRFAMLHGALFCFAYIILKRMSMLDDSKQGCLMSMKVSLITVTLSIIAITAYTFWAVHCTSKQMCNQIHSYASVLPISSFILIRNIPGYLRSVYSSFFAWFGKISLELFIGQYHIWLAADTKGILVLTSSSWPTLNLVVSTFIFICIAHEISRLTGIFAKYVVGSARDGDRSALVRFLCICILLAFLMLINDNTKSTSKPQK